MRFEQSGKSDKKIFDCVVTVELTSIGVVVYGSGSHAWERRQNRFSRRKIFVVVRRNINFDEESWGHRFKTLGSTWSMGNLYPEFCSNATL